MTKKLTMDKQLVGEEITQASRGGGDEERPNDIVSTRPNDIVSTKAQRFLLSLSNFFSDYLSIVGFVVIVFGLRQLFPASAAEMAARATNKMTSPSSWMILDWTQLPEELLQVISENLDNCFDVVHARSVCSSN
ncbi:unnamed protein product [Microthlaspi erraticum]|uniref:F-box domain-containing protein n=1 Tax=Microthlaspi erraticum TaxID=1685480 RepID=A0A6D2K831_9BRAS|nr:unnamed protein product [Microthlaspi erraticum]